MTNGNSSGLKSVPGAPMNPARGGSGEGAQSALEAMLRKRQMGVQPQTDTADTALPGQREGSKAKE